MSIFDKLKDYIEEKKYKFTSNDSEYVRLNHLEVVDMDKNGNGDICHTQGAVYKIPDGMPYEQAFQVISFLIDKVSKDLNLEGDSLPVMLITSKCLERYSFKIAKKYYDLDVIDLAISRGSDRISFSKTSAISVDKKHWYSEGITQDQISAIYKSRKEKVDFSTVTKKSIGDALCADTQIIPQREVNVM